MIMLDHYNRRAEKISDEAITSDVWIARRHVSKLTWQKWFFFWLKIKDSITEQLRVRVAWEGPPHAKLLRLVHYWPTSRFPIRRSSLPGGQRPILANKAFWTDDDGNWELPTTAMPAPRPANGGTRPWHHKSQICWHIEKHKIDAIKFTTFQFTVWTCLDCYVN